MAESQDFFTLGNIWWWTFQVGLGTRTLQLLTVASVITPRPGILETIDSLEALTALWKPSSHLGLQCLSGFLMDFLLLQLQFHSLSVHSVSLAPVLVVLQNLVLLLHWPATCNCSAAATSTTMASLLSLSSWHATASTDWLLLYSCDQSSLTQSRGEKIIHF